MSTTDLLLKVTNKLGDLKYKIANPDYFVKSEMDRARTVREITALEKLKERLERLITINS